MKQSINCESFRSDRTYVRNSPEKRCTPGWPNLLGQSCVLPRFPRDSENIAWCSTTCRSRASCRAPRTSSREIFRIRSCPSSNRESWNSNSYMQTWASTLLPYDEIHDAVVEVLLLRLFERHLVLFFFNFPHQLFSFFILRRHYVRNTQIRQDYRIHVQYLQNSTDYLPKAINEKTSE